jgi:hypothetical protein
MSYNNIFNKLIVNNTFCFATIDKVFYHVASCETEGIIIYN